MHQVKLSHVLQTGWPVWQLASGGSRSHSKLHKNTPSLCLCRPTANTAQALELQQLLPAVAGPAPLEQLLLPSFTAINNPGVSWAVGNSGKQLLYPDWMQGTWQVRLSVLREHSHVLTHADCIAA